MGSLSRPRGTLIRHPVDWYPERCGRGTASVPFDGAHLGFVALFNDDSQGRQLRVYGLQAEGAFTVDVPTVYVAEGTVGTLVMQGTPLIVGNGATPGQIYSGYDSANRGTAFALTVFLSAYQGFAWAPYAILKQGYSLILYAPDFNTTIGADFVWLVD
jgi:hypothetical protein